MSNDTEADENSPEEGGGVTDEAPDSPPSDEGGSEGFPDGVADEPADDARHEVGVGVRTHSVHQCGDVVAVASRRERDDGDGREHHEHLTERPREQAAEL